MKTALVTGAGRGIGYSICEHLLKSGFKTMGISRTKADLELLEGKGDFLPFLGDLNDSSVWLKILDFCEQNHITPNVLVNNAGVYLPDTITSTSSFLQDNLLINLVQVRELTALLWGRMCASKEAHIFNIISVLGKEIRPEAASYTISKQALLAYNKLLFAEGKKQGVKVTGILPSSVYTSSWKDSGVNSSELISADDIAQTVMYSLSLSPSAVAEEIHIKCMSEGY